MTTEERMAQIRFAIDHVTKEIENGLLGTKKPDEVGYVADMYWLLDTLTATQGQVTQLREALRGLLRATHTLAESVASEWGSIQREERETIAAAEAALSATEPAAQEGGNN